MALPLVVVVYVNFSGFNDLFRTDSSVSKMVASSFYGVSTETLIDGIG